MSKYIYIYTNLATGISQEHLMLLHRHCRGVTGCTSKQRLAEVKDCRGWRSIFLLPMTSGRSKNTSPKIRAPENSMRGLSWFPKIYSAYYSNSLFFVFLISNWSSVHQISFLEGPHFADINGNFRTLKGDYSTI